MLERAWPVAVAAEWLLVPASTVQRHCLQSGLVLQDSEQYCPRNRSPCLLEVTERGDRTSQT